jgi:Secretion system C-terminal sorting domain
VVGGLFKSINDSAFNNIAAWDGNHWHKLGEGVVWSASKYSSEVTCMSIYQNDLIAGGYFDSAGGVYAPWVARWNGTQWSPMLGLCGNLRGIYTDNIHDLYACGDFTKNIPYNCDAYGVAHWNGSSWDDLGIGSGGRGSCVTFFNNDLILGGVSFLAGMPVNGIVGLKNGIETQVAGLSKLKFSISPNPPTEVVNISLPFSTVTIIISDLYGREQQHFEINSGNSTELNIHSLQNGVYIVSVRDNKGNISSEELFKE